MSRLRVVAWLRVLTARVRMRRRRGGTLLATVLATQAAWGLTATIAAASEAGPRAGAQRVAQYDAAPAGHQDVIQRAAREGIRVLSPIQVLPVTPLASVPFRELPLDPMPCEMQPTEGLIDASLRPLSASGPPSGIDASDSGGNTSAVDASDSEGKATANQASPDRVAALPVECANLFPDIAPVRAQPYSFGLETLDPEWQDPVVVVTRGHPSTHAWFSAVGSQQGFSYSGGQWTYRDTVGPTVSMGNLIANAPIWGSTVPIGGLQVSSSWNSGAQTLSEGAFAYSSTVGRLNYTDITAQAGAIDYGVTAGSGSLRYGLIPGLTLESQMQTAPNLSTQGLGTTYAAGDLGTFQMGATQSTFDSVNAWRYRFGYNVNLAESLSLAVTNEQIGAGFGDLSAYRSGAAAAPTMRNTLAAGVPLHGWGTLTGTYTGTRESGLATERRFGLEHSMLVAPSVRLAVGADRDVITGDYEMRAGISMPVDAFMLGRWLPW